MCRRKSIKLWFVCSLLCLLTSFSAWADTEDGAVPKRNGQTEIQIGVVVNHMGKLRFEVLEQRTLVPIPGTSVEIFIPTLDRYVLFGLTDANGIYELDVAYNMDPGTPDSGQFTGIEGGCAFTGNSLYLSSNNIRYRVYKAGWLPRPSIGETMLEITEIPQVITIYLYDKTGDDDGGGDPTTPAVIPPESTLMGKSIISSINEILQSIMDLAISQSDSSSGAIPKTGVEGTIHYWLLGFVFSLLVGGIVFVLLKRDKKSSEGDRSE